MSERKERSSLVERAAERLAEGVEQPQDRDSTPVQLAKALDLTESDTLVGLKGRATAPAVMATTTLSIDRDRLQRMGIVPPSETRNPKTEEFRGIKRSLLKTVAKLEQEGSSKARTVMVTSAHAAEGKTYVAISLALNLSIEPDMKVVLVDCDLVQPGLAEVLGLRESPGLADLLEDPALELGEALIQTDVPSLLVLPAGRAHPRGPELLAGNRMKRIMQELAIAYPGCIVIFDTPPVLVASEPGALAGIAGQAVFVVRSGRTTPSTIKEALAGISSVSETGFVLNRSRPGVRHMRRYAYGRYRGERP